MKQESKKRILKFDTLGVTDLEGGFDPFVVETKIVDNIEVKEYLTVKHFANTIYKHASRSIELDAFLTELHSNGEAEITNELEIEIIESTKNIWGEHVEWALKRLLNNLK